MKKASIIVINYNDKIRVKRAIDSALNQTWKNTEVIVVDDGSDEETRELYKPYFDKVKFIQLEKDDKTKRTPSRARNEGLKYVTGEFLTVLDSDNYMGSSYIESMIKYDKDVLFCNWEIIGLEPYKVNIERVWNFKNPILQNYLMYTHLDHQCLLIRKSYLDKCGHYDERLPRSQDCDLIVRLILGGGEWQHIQDNLFFFEKHEKDQMKQYASIHGKTLWTLKNNINIQWILGRLKDPMLVLSFNQAINDFCNNDEWSEDYNNSDFKKLQIDHSKILNNQIKEKAEVKYA